MPSVESAPAGICAASRNAHFWVLEIEMRPRKSQGGRKASLTYFNLANKRNSTWDVLGLNAGIGLQLGSGSGFKK
eukprot:3662374-Pleurochrysis_carterae.AAC.1